MYIVYCIVLDSQSRAESWKQYSFNLFDGLEGGKSADVDETNIKYEISDLINISGIPNHYQVDFWPKNQLFELIFRLCFKG